MQIQPRLTASSPQPAPPPPPEPAPDKPVLFDGFKSRQTLAATTAYTAALGATLGLALTRDPSNLFRNVLGGAVGATLLAPAAASENLSQRGFSKAVVNTAGSSGLAGAIAGAGAGCLAALALSLVVPESHLLEAATVVLAVAGSATGAAFMGGAKA